MIQIFRKCLCFILSATLLITNIQTTHSQSVVAPKIPVPADPLLLKGLIVNLDNPWQMDFIVDTASAVSRDPEKPSGDAEFPHDEILKLTKYFLAGLTIPEEDLWVNLSPAEPDRIMPESLSQTSLGNDLLNLDYQLKKLTASLLDPNTESGKTFWETVYGQWHMVYGENQNNQTIYHMPNTNDLIQTFNKIWIVPASATVYEQDGKAFVVENRLKVMMEEDYLVTGNEKRVTGTNENVRYASPITRCFQQTILPLIEQEINEGETFANLRQIYNSLLLATWYKTRLKESILSASYADHKNTNGLQTDDASAKERVYQQYLDIFRQGAANIIKEEYNPQTQNLETRHYFTGGLKVNYKADAAMTVTQKNPNQLPVSPNAQFAKVDLQYTLANAAMLSVGDVLKENPQTTLEELAERLQTTVDHPNFKTMVVDYLRTIPKSNLQIHASGLIFGENLVQYMLDSEPDTGHMISRFKAKYRLKQRRIARELFVRHFSDDPYARQKNISPQKRDELFRNLLDIPQGVPLESSSVDIKKTAQKINNLIHISAKNFSWPEFEKLVRKIFLITTDYKRLPKNFRYHLIKEGIAKLQKEDNIIYTDVIGLHAGSLTPLTENILDVDDSLKIGILKGFRRNQINRAFETKKKDIQALQEQLKNYTFHVAKNYILNLVLQENDTFLRIPDANVTSQFESMIADITRQTRNAFPHLRGDALEQKLKEQLILVYVARLLAIEDFIKFETELTTIEFSSPVDRRNITGIALMGSNTDQPGWITDVLILRAKALSLKVSSYTDDLPSTGSPASSYETILRNIHNQAELGINRLGMGTIFAVDFTDESDFRHLTVIERTELDQLQKATLKTLSTKGVFVTLSPTMQQAIYASRPETSLRQLIKHLTNHDVKTAVASTSSGIFDVTPSEDLFEFWKNAPNLPFQSLEDETGHSLPSFSKIMDFGVKGRFYHTPEEDIQSIQQEIDQLRTKQKNDKGRPPIIVVFGSARTKQDDPNYQQVKRLGALIQKKGLTIATGGGPGMMAAPLEGYIESREKHENNHRHKTIGVNIDLPFQEPRSPLVEEASLYKHFGLRKIALATPYMQGAIVTVGGLGTIDEFYEILRRGRPIALLNKSYYQPIMDAAYKTWQENGLWDNVKDHLPLITDDEQEALDFITRNLDTPRPYIEDEEFELRKQEIEDGILELSKLPRAVEIVGNPNPDSKLGRQAINELKQTVHSLFEAGTPVRVVSRELLETVLEVAGTRYIHLVQAVLYEGDANDPFTEKEKNFERNHPTKTILIKKGLIGDTIHQILASYNSKGMIALPGDDKVNNLVFDLLCAMQTGRIRGRPIAIIGKQFYEPLFQAMKNIYEGYKYISTVTGELVSLPTITPGDIERFVKYINPKNIKDILSILGISRLPNGEADHAAMASPVGGIDLKNSNVFRIEGEGSDVFRNNGEISAVEIESLTPVIVNVRSAGNVQELFTPPVRR